MTEHKINEPLKLPCVQIESDGQISPFINVEISTDSPSKELKVKSRYNYRVPAYSDHRYYLSNEIQFQTVFINAEALTRPDLLLTVFEFRDGDSFKFPENEDHVFVNILHSCCKITWIPPRPGAVPKPDHIFYDDREYPFSILPRGYRYLIQLVDGGEWSEEVYFIEQNGSFTPKGAPTKADLNNIAIYEDTY